MSWVLRNLGLNQFIQISCINTFVWTSVFQHYGCVFEFKEISGLQHVFWFGPESWWDCDGGQVLWGLLSFFKLTEETIFIAFLLYRCLWFDRSVVYGGWLVFSNLQRKPFLLPSFCITVFELIWSVVLWYLKPFYSWIVNYCKFVLLGI